MRKLTGAFGSAGSLLATGVGGLLSVVFIASMLGGNVYKTECVTATGLHAEGWELPTSVPFLWSAGEGCEETTLTRVALGKVGIMSKVD